MASITLRAVKGTPLTHNEVDDNFSQLKIGADIAETATSANNPDSVVKRNAAGLIQVSTVEATIDVITNSIGQSAAQQHTVPAVASDTITLNAATQSLSNKTLTSPSVTGTVAGNYTNSGQVSFTNATAPIISSKIGPTSAQQHTIPSVASDTVTLNTASQTLTNKTLTSPAINGGSVSNASVAATTLSATGATSLAGMSYSGEITTTSITSLQVPVGSTAERPAGANGKIRYNTTLTRYEGFNSLSGTWAQLGGGATGGGANQAFIENDNVVTDNYTITTGKNAVSAGPITVNNGVTVTIPDGSSWVVV